MALLHAKVHTPVGVFVGVINSNEDATMDDLVEARDNIQTMANKLTYLVLYTTDGELVLPGDLLKQSAILFNITE